MTPGNLMSEASAGAGHLARQSQAAGGHLLRVEFARYYIVRFANLVSGFSPHNGDTVVERASRDVWRLASSFTYPNVVITRADKANHWTAKLLLFPPTANIGFNKPDDTTPLSILGIYTTISYCTGPNCASPPVETCEVLEYES